MFGQGQGAAEPQQPATTTTAPAVSAAVEIQAAPGVTAVPAEVNEDFMALLSAALGSAGLRSRRFWLAVAAFVIVLAQYALGNLASGAAMGDIIKALGIYAASEASTDIARAVSGGIAARKR